MNLITFNLYGERDLVYWRIVEILFDKEANVLYYTYIDEEDKLQKKSLNLTGAGFKIQ